VESFITSAIFCQAVNTALVAFESVARGTRVDWNGTSKSEPEPEPEPREKEGVKLKGIFTPWYSPSRPIKVMPRHSEF